MKLRVLCLTPHYPPEGGEFVERLVLGLQEQVEVRVLHLGSLPAKVGTDAGGVSVIRTQWSSKTMVSKFGESIALLRGIAAEGWVPDLMHTHFFTVGPYWKLASLLVFGRWVPQVHTEHYSAFLLDALTWKDRWMARAFLFLADRVVAVSKPLAGKVQPLCMRSAVEVVGNIVDDRFYCASDELEADRSGVCGVANYDSPVKNIDRLVQAWKLLGKPDVPLRLAGSCSQGLRAKITEELSGFTVEFLGRQTAIELRKLYRHSQCLVVASDHETFSVVAAEALATGTPVVTTPCQGPETFLNVKAGVVGHDMSAASLSRALGEALDRSWEPSEVRQAVAPFRSDYVVEAYYRLYDEALSCL